MNDNLQHHACHVIRLEASANVQCRQNQHEWMKQPQEGFQAGRLHLHKVQLTHSMSGVHGTCQEVCGTILGAFVGFRSCLRYRCAIQDAPSRCTLCQLGVRTRRYFPGSHVLRRDMQPALCTSRFALFFTGAWMVHANNCDMPQLVDLVVQTVHHPDCMPQPQNQTARMQPIHKSSCVLQAVHM